MNAGQDVGGGWPKRLQLTAIPVARLPESFFDCDKPRPTFRMATCFVLLENRTGEKSRHRDGPPREPGSRSDLQNYDPLGASSSRHAVVNRVSLVRAR